MCATPCLARLNTRSFGAMTRVWFIGHPHIIKDVLSSSPPFLIYRGAAVLSLGNFLIAYMTVSRFE